MIPRLPPLLLAMLGSASVYGIKIILDRMEPKALGPPGSSQRQELEYKLRQRVRRAGYAAAAAGVLYAGYWAYDARLHRPSPATLPSHPEEYEEFHQDQYSNRDKHQKEESINARRLQREREEDTKRRLEAEQAEMKKTIAGR